jgi:hypothetical protein
MMMQMHPGGKTKLQCKPCEDFDMTPIIIEDNIPWTRLQGTVLFQLAAETMSRSKRRHYHNFNHVIHLYRHAQYTFAFAYSRALDIAILAHDVIFDSLPDRELRSIEWLRIHLGEDDPDFAEAVEMIIATIDHRLTADYRMVLLDLADFIEPVTSDENTDLLRLEAADLHGVRGVGFSMSCEAYLGGLVERVRENPNLLMEHHRNHHENICRGICRTRNLLGSEVHCLDSHITARSN